jgi:hypothetical protein
MLEWEAYYEKYLIKRRNEKNDFMRDGRAQ